MVVVDWWWWCDSGSCSDLQTKSVPVDVTTNSSGKKLQNSERETDLD